MRSRSRKLAFIATGLIALFPIVLMAQSTSFTYQGKLTDGGNAANGSFDLQFSLFDNSSGGSQIGSTLTRSNTAVASGVFTVQLDFGVNAFPGANRFLEIGVRPAGVGSFTLLTPRQQISSTPYAIRTLNAGTADGLSSSCVACVQDSQINSMAGSKVSGTIPVAGVPAGSGNYIQNSETQQASSNFNISGSGIVGVNLGVGNELRIPTGFISLGNTVYNLTRLSISDGALWTTNNWRTVITLASTSAIAWDRNGSNQALGIGRGFLGLHFFRTSSVVGTTNPATTDMLIGDTGNVGIGTILPARLLHVAGRARVGNIPAEASSASVCFNSEGDLLQCGFSSLKHKTNVTAFRNGLDIVSRLKPISFDWKDGSGHDIGLGAEDVAEIAPSLVFTNASGEVTGVKYERLNILLINAIKEQQQQLEKQQNQIAQILTVNSKLKSRLRALEYGVKRKSKRVRY